MKHPASNVKRIFGVLAVCTLTMGSTSGASAADPVVASPPNDATNYLSDRVKWTIKIGAKKVDMTKLGDSSYAPTPVCIPQFTTLKGIGSLTISGKTVAAFTITSDVTNKDPKTGTVACSGTDPSLVSQNDVVIFDDPNFISSIPPDRYGLTYGTLIVPFKYQIKGSKDFTGSSTLGGYLGFRQDRSGVTGLALQYVGFLGVSNVSVPTTTNGTTTNQDKFGLSYGIGILGTVKNNFHLGLVVGADHVSPSAGYVNNGKPWIAISLGADFSN